MTAPKIVVIGVALLGLLSEGRPLPAGNKRSSFNKLLMISFDGFRWNYDQDVDTPNLDLLVKEGVKAEFITPPALTMTSPSHFTTITGTLVIISRLVCILVLLQC
ncbi:ENPP7 phosphodiesterase, partial [Polypterus senegalus]|nr:ENPP7 phosphodiesterase [Polypterus senegalus]